jgi:hypothetical protein
MILVGVEGSSGVEGLSMGVGVEVSGDVMILVGESFSSLLYSSYYFSFFPYYFSSHFVLFLSSFYLLFVTPISN